MVLKPYLKLQEKDSLRRNRYFFVIVRLVVGEHHPKFSRMQFRSVWHFTYVLYVQRNPRSYFIGKFRSIRKKLRYQFYLARNKTAEVMEEVCEVDLKNLRKNFRVEELFSARNVSRYFPVKKKFSYVNAETR